MSSIATRQLNTAVTLFSGTVTSANASVNGTAAFIGNTDAGVVFELDVTTAAAAAGDTLDVKVQTTVDGTNWVNVCWFTQVLGNGGAKRYFGKVSATEPMTMFENATSLTAGNVRHIIGDQWRINYALVDSGGHGQSFTFAVYACPI